MQQTKTHIGYTTDTRYSTQEPRTLGGSRSDVKRRLAHGMNDVRVIQVQKVVNRRFFVAVDDHRWGVDLDRLRSRHLHHRVKPTQ